MNIFLIKRETNIPMNIIEAYFFEYLERDKYPRKTEYFQKHKMLPQIYIPEYQFTIPFIILNKILKSIENPDTKISHPILGPGEFITNKIFLPSRIWTNSIFNQENISHIYPKYELFKTISKEIQNLLDFFRRYNKFSKNALENFCDILLRFQSDFSHLFSYIKSSEFIMKEENEEFIFINKRVINIDYINADSHQTRDICLDSNYVQTFTKFLKISLDLEKVLNYSYLSIHDHEGNFSHSNKENEYFLNKKLLIGKFYTETVLKFLLFDIKDIILKLIKNK